jgi:hypothetical protein
MRYLSELNTGLNSSREPGSPAIRTGYESNNPKFSGLGSDAKKFGGPQTTVGETNFASSDRKVAGSGTY